VVLCPVLCSTVLVLHQLPDKIIEKYGLFLILWNIFMNISQSSSTLLNGNYEKQGIFCMRVGCSFSLYSTVRLIFFSCLHRHWLKLKSWPVMTESGQTWFIVLTTAASTAVDISLVTRNNTDSSAELTNNNMLFLSYPVKVQTKPDTCTSYAVCFRNQSIGHTTERIAADSF